MRNESYIRTHRISTSTRLHAQCSYDENCAATASLLLGIFFGLIMYPAPQSHLLINSLASWCLTSIDPHGSLRAPWCQAVVERSRTPLRAAARRIRCEPDGDLVELRSSRHAWRPLETRVAWPGLAWQLERTWGIQHLPNFRKWPWKIRKQTSENGLKNPHKSTISQTSAHGNRPESSCWCAWLPFVGNRLGGRRCPPGPPGIVPVHPGSMTIHSRFFIFHHPSPKKRHQNSNYANSNGFKIITIQKSSKIQ